MEPDPELVDRLRMVIARLARRLRQESDVDLTPSQFAALSTISHREPITLGELAMVERVRPPTMTRIVAVLEEAGLVAREVDPSDRRVARVRATPEGDALLAHARTRRDAYLAELLSALPADSQADLERMVHLLEQLSDIACRPPARNGAAPVETRR
jgi:DNA-binding MarR family transcriptional regulator